MSRNFISEFAETLLERYAGDLSGIVVMFPSLRARTFFNEAVSNIVNHPVWQPSWSTIDELMERGANLVRGERRFCSFRSYIKYISNTTLRSSSTSSTSGAICLSPILI